MADLSVLVRNKRYEAVSGVAFPSYHVGLFSAALYGVALYTHYKAGRNKR